MEGKRSLYARGAGNESRLTREKEPIQLTMMLNEERRNMRRTVCGKYVGGRGVETL